MKSLTDATATATCRCIDENGVRSSPGTILGYPLHPRTLLIVQSARFPHESVTLWEASGVSLLSLFGVFGPLVFFWLSGVVLLVTLQRQG